MKSKSEKYIFYVVSSPMQLINAYEYKQTHCQNDTISHLRIIYHFEKRRKVFEECLKLMEWDEISFSRSIDKYGVSGSAMTFFNLVLEFLYQIKFYVIKRKKYNELVLGHYLTFVQRGYTRGFEPKITIVDDGNFSFHVHKYRNQELGGDNIISIQKYDTVNGLLYRLFNVSLRHKRIHFFSNYPVQISDIDSVTKNTYTYWRQYLARSKKRINTVPWFIGGDYSEIGWLDETYYLDILRNINKRHPKGLIYIKKWSESDEKLKSVSQTIKIVEFNLPLEVVLLTSEELPCKIYGLISSVLFNISPLLKSIVDFEMIQLPFTEIEKQGMGYFKEVYERAEFFPLQVLPIDR